MDNSPHPGGASTDRKAILAERTQIAASGEYLAGCDRSRRLLKPAMSWLFSVPKEGGVSSRLGKI